VFLMAILVWQIAKTLRTRAAGKREDAHRELAERAIEMQERISAGLERSADELAELRKRLESVERVLTEVD
jgi:hypothetical protein